VPEAVEILCSMHSQDQLAFWAAQPLDEALWKAHFQAGLWIRNEWMHGDPAPLVRRMREFAYLVHDDDASGFILEALWRVLNGENCPTIEELLEHRYPGCAPGAGGGVESCSLTSPQVPRISGTHTMGESEDTHPISSAFSPPFEVEASAR